MDYNKIKEENKSKYPQEGILNNNISNPIDTSKIMPLNTRTSANKLYGGWANSFAKTTEINYSELISAINNAILNQKDALQLFYSIHKEVCLKLNLDFFAIGIYNVTSNYINMKLTEKTGSSYSSKILLTEDDNVIIRSFKNKEVIFTTDSEYLKMNYLSQNSTTIIPLIAFGECLGVAIYSDNNNQLFELYKLIANYYAIFYKNRQLSDLVDRNTDADSLTGLSNHKKLQEDLAREIERCNLSDKTMAFCIFDIANISQINSVQVEKVLLLIENQYNSNI